MYFSQYFKDLQSNRLELSFKKLSADAVLPTYGSDGAIGLDLYALETVSVHPWQVTKVRTGIAVKIPHGFYGRIAPRSGLAAKFGIDVLAGVIDDDYRGELVVLLTTLTSSSADFLEIKKGDRVAQLILEQATKFKPVFVDTLDDTGRGLSGFGSTGK